MPNLVRLEAGLVGERATPFDVVAQVQVSIFPRRAFLEQAKYIEGAQRTLQQVGIIEKIDGRHAVGKPVGVADADELAIEVVAPFLREEWIAHERFAVALRILGGMLRPTLRFGLERVKAI